MLQQKILWVSVAIAATSVSVESQQSRVSELVAESQFPEPFSNITGVREMRDGSLLVADRLERAVYRLDFDGGDYYQLGDNGQGPQEYEQPMGLFAMPGDSTLMIDMGNARSAVMDPYGDITETRNIMSDAGFMMPGGVDSQGRLLVDGTSMVTGGTANQSVVPLMRLDRASGDIDTLASLNRTPPRMSNETQTLQSPSGGGVRLRGSMIPQPFTIPDRWVVLPDGRVAIARFENYRLDYVHPDGRITRGPAVDYEPLEVTRRDRELWEESMSNRTAVMSTPNGSQTINLPAPDMSQVEFPDFLPPFTRNMFAAPDGTVWVERQQHMDEDRPLLDVFDSDGNLVNQVRLPAARTVLGIGDGVVYARYQDADDLQWLERYRILTD